MKGICSKCIAGASNYLLYVTESGVLIKGFLESGWEIGPGFPTIFS